jgi:hypothetical protein
MIIENNINYKYIGEFDINSILYKIIENKLSWDDYKYRQERYKDHEETKTIPLIWCEKFKEIKKWEPYYSIFKDEIDLIEKYLRNNLSNTGRIMSFVLINLPAGKSIKRHRDSNPVGNRFNRCHRIHIPIKTNTECIFEIDGDIKNLKEGEIWEINNVKKLHSVSNNGTSDRIHLLIDWDPFNI